MTDFTVADFLAGTGLIRPDATAEDLAFRVDFDGQIDRYLISDLATGDLSNTVASILIGLNDFNDFVPQSLETVADDAIAFGVAIATATIRDAAQLAAAGVGTIIINELPTIDVFPTFEGLGADLQQLSFVEWGTVFEEISADFSSFGFQDFDETLVLGNNSADGPNPALADIPADQVGFQDAVHPTTDVHGILAAFQTERLTSNVMFGAAENEALRGTALNDLVLGRDGGDTVRVGGGRDVVIAGVGHDTVTGGKSNDLIAGGAGDDRLLGNRGQDIIADGDGYDFNAGGRAADLLIDGDGDDVLAGGRGADLFVFTEAGLLGQEADEVNTIRGGRGDDTLIIRVADAEADLGRTDNGATSELAALGLTVTNVETIVIIEGTDLSGEDFFNDQFEEAALWNLI